ncbi:MAG: diaminopimelate decarboxylase [Cyanobacteria bacterium SZAS-4]|nr:diaminopimelate decarboxylase [Cyanobacteria bacterium SZAS-4]
MSQSTRVVSPNVEIMPISATTDAQGHLIIGGCDTVELAKQFGTPLYVIDEATVRASASAFQAGLSAYKKSRPLYAGKAFLCTAMCHLIRKLGFGLDVVSEGELFTAVKAGFPADLIYLHGNNKSAKELQAALNYPGVKIVADSTDEIKMLAEIAQQSKVKASVLIRVTPGVEPDTHEHIKTGQHNSKFGIPLDRLNNIVELILKYPDALQLVGLHAHIGSQSHDLGPFLELIDIMADRFAAIKKEYGVELTQLDVGGGLGIAYTKEDRPTPIYEWAHSVATKVAEAFSKRNMELPELFVEPGRSMIGTAGITLYRAGHTKDIDGAASCLSVDGGMADNPRPITYQAKYTTCVANRMTAPTPEKPVSLVGRYCESGDIIVKEAYLAAQRDDVIAVFGTGAYNYSMASNYNRTTRPACVLVLDGKAEVIIERETNEDLVRQDRILDRLL